MSKPKRVYVKFKDGVPVGVALERTGAEEQYDTEWIKRSVVLKAMDHCTCSNSTGTLDEILEQELADENL